jgi:hypothetical protein
MVVVGVGVGVVVISNVGSVSSSRGGSSPAQAISPAPNIRIRNNRIIFRMGNLLETYGFIL